MKKLFIPFITLLSIQVHAFGDSDILDFVSEGVHVGSDSEEVCYVDVRVYEGNKLPVAVTIGENSRVTEISARFNELSDYKLESVEKDPNRLVYKINRDARGPLDAPLKAKLEIVKTSSGTKVFIEKKVKSFFGWKVEESASCLL